MTNVINHASISFSAVLTVTEAQIRALDALVGYGDDAFLKAFEEKLGKAYIRDHHAGLRSFFETVREQLLPPLHDISQARRDLREAMEQRERDRQQRLLGQPKAD